MTKVHENPHQIVTKLPPKFPEHTNSSNLINFIHNPTYHLIPPTITPSQQLNDLLNYKFTQLIDLCRNSNVNNISLD